MAKTEIIIFDGERCFILGGIWTCEKKATQELFQEISDKFYRTNYEPDKDWARAQEVIEMFGGEIIFYDENEMAAEPPNRIY